MNVAGIPLIKQLVRTLDFPALQTLAKTSLTLETSGEVRKLLKTVNREGERQQRAES